MVQTLRRGVIAPLTVILLTAGCDESDGKRAARMAAEHARSQAAQSRQTVELQREVAAGTRRLVQENAEARREIVALQRDIQAQSAEVGRQRDLLAADRRELAAQRRSDPILAAAITQVGLLLACLLPLVLCWHLLRRPVEPADDEVVLEILLEDLMSGNPRFLPRHDVKPALPYRGNDGRAVGDPDLPVLPGSSDGTSPPE